MFIDFHIFISYLFGKERKKMMNDKNIQQNFTYQFPAIRGIQAGREYYSFMCPLEYLNAMFDRSDNELPPEMSSQRMLNKGRIPAMARYVLENPKTYTFSSLTASVNGKVEFNPVSNQPPIDTQIGTLTIPLSAIFAINDGQHRLAAIRMALKSSDTLKYETISIVLFVDKGLKHSQQMFADLNRYAVRPTKSLSLLYDHRDPLAKLAYSVAKEVSYFKGMVEMEKTSISNRSKKLFTLSGIYQANNRLLNKKEGAEISLKEEVLVKEFWEAVGEGILDWKLASKSELSSFELRQECIHAHGVALQALANLGITLLSSDKNWKNTLLKLRDIDWRRSNSIIWEGRATVGGKINRSQSNIILTGNVLKKKLGLTLDAVEEKFEKKYLQGKN